MLDHIKYGLFGMDVPDHKMAKPRELREYTVTIKLADGPYIVKNFSEEFRQWSTPGSHYIHYSVCTIEDYIDDLTIKNRGFMKQEDGVKAITSIKYKHVSSRFEYYPDVPQYFRRSK